MARVVCVQALDMFRPTLNFAYLHAALFRWYAQRGHAFVWIPTDPVPELQTVLADLQPSCLVRWNGSADPPWMQAYPTIHYEFAWFGQRQHTWFWQDVERIREAPTTPYDPVAFKDWRDAYLAGQPTGPHPEPPYTLVLGQCPQDATLAGQMSLEALVRETLARTTGPVVYRAHPLHLPPPNVTDARLSYSDPRVHALYPSLRAADAVYGICSTALIESALVGTKTLALGTWRWPVPGVRALQHLAQVVKDPAAHFPWLDNLRRRQIRFDAPDFSHPATIEALTP